MRLLVIHQNFPGQFGHLVSEWSKRPGWDVRGLGRDTAPGLPGFNHLIRYNLARNIRPDQHLYLRQIEASTLHGQAAAREMIKLKRSGFTPDAILAHPGWGETLFVKDVYPSARLVHYCEWYYNAEGQDLGFDPEFPLTFDDRARVRIWNAQHALDLIQCDVGISPTHWQRSRYPEILRSKIVVRHEGIDIDNLGPDPSATVTTPNGLVLKAGDPVITYVARNLEPYRGFHIFMRALQKIQLADTSCHALIVGGDGVSYGRRPNGARNWREKMLAEVHLDPARTHFLGRVPRERYINILQVSAAHVYLSYPFVLSWSLLEAMACGASVVASNTAPVREAVSYFGNGTLVEFFDISALTASIREVLASSRSNPCSEKVMTRVVSRYGMASALAGYDAVLDATRDPTEPTVQPRSERHPTSCGAPQRARSPGNCSDKQSLD